LLRLPEPGSTADRKGFPQSLDAKQRGHSFGSFADEAYVV
jgi:hypothetical protein